VRPPGAAALLLCSKETSLRARSFRHAALATALTLLCSWSNAQPADAAAQEPALAEQARELLASGRTAQALTTARRAIAQHPSDYKGHYYLAYALMEAGETEAALRSAAQAEALAGSNEAKAAVAALRAAIGARDGLKEAESALADGLNAKASRLYLEVWKRGGLPADKTLAVAELLQRQGDVAHAVTVLRDTTTRHLGTPAAQAAAQRLSALEPELLKLSAAAVAEAEQREPQDPERARWLRNALEHQQDNTAARLMLANDAAEAANWSGLQAQLRELQRRGQLEALLQERKLALGRWQQHAELRQLLADIWGEQRGVALLQSNSAQAGPVSPQRAERLRARALADATQGLLASGVVPGNGVAFRDCDVCPEMVWVPAGKMPVRSILRPGQMRWHQRLEFRLPFAVGRNELRFDEWDACVAEGACRQGVPEGATIGTFFDTAWGRAGQPVVNVDLSDAQSYARWLSRKTGHHYRVMTLAEFVYATLAGNADTTHALVANCKSCAISASQPHAAGSQPATSNGWGLRDMVGNVREIFEGCALASNDDYSAWPTDGSIAPSQHCEHANVAWTAGGSFDSSPSAGGVALEPIHPFHQTGFRLVRTLVAR
jgi:formylglycine-generating enzyme required for sulfatase activity